MNCWEVIKCREEFRATCPAYPDNGLVCWKVSGTMCEGGKHKMESLFEKLTHCQKCEFYQKYASKV